MGVRRIGDAVAPSDGKLLVVSTPIGNLSDLSERAREAIASADLVACEDTRRTGKLLSHLGLSKRLVSLHEHNEAQRLPRLLEVLAEGKILVLVSDAGTPLISDPGFLLVREAARRGVVVEPVPGPSSVLAALVVSGLPPYPFTFAGFPPPRSGRRRRFYRRFAELKHTLIFFESPHRLLASLEDALAELGDRPVMVGRELTKLHEELLRGQLGQVLGDLRSRPRLKGEFVIVISGKADDEAAHDAAARDS